MKNQNTTGIEELKLKVTELINIINDVSYAIPYKNNSLNKELTMSNKALNNLLQELQHYA